MQLDLVSSELVLGLAFWFKLVSYIIRDLKGHWQRKYLLAISILLDKRTMKILSFPS